MGWASKRNGELLKRDEAATGCAVGSGDFIRLHTR
jgi:hypothetical protein